MTITLPLRQQGHPGYLGDGTHHVRITSARESVAKTGTEQLVIELEAVDGPNAGKIARAWLSLTDSARAFLMYFATAVFPHLPDDQISVEPQDLIGREVIVEVEWPDHQEYPQVARYYPV